MLLLFQLDVDSEGGGGLGSDGRGGGVGIDGRGDPADLHHPPRSRRETTDLSQLTARERRSLTCRLGEAYQRWNETEGQREAKLHQQRKRVAKQAKLQEEATTLATALREALRLAEHAVGVVSRLRRASVPTPAPRPHTAPRRASSPPP